MVAAADALAYAAHLGQLDKAGAPYISHPRRVAALLDDDDHDGRTVALLHDVIEDTDRDEQDLRAAGFPARIVAAVRAVTHVRHEPRRDYYARVRANELAMRVKLADIADNTDPHRLSLLDEATRTRLVAKYAAAVAELTSAPGAGSQVPDHGR